ncbi:hypothetical protein D3C75_967710 [compost metagenome]
MVNSASPLLFVVTLESDNETREPAKLDNAIATDVFGIIAPFSSLAITLTRTSPPNTETV